MPRYLKFVRTLTVIAGVLFIVSALIVFLALSLGQQGKLKADLRLAIAAFAVGSFLVTPHRGVLKSRFGLFWVGLTFLLLAVGTCGLAVTFWSMWQKHSFEPLLISVFALWLCFFGNAEYARRSFRIQRSHENVPNQHLR
jgi:hypothetical protein